jgi:tetratricopeptide (TPR) repeat protein
VIEQQPPQLQQQQQNEVLVQVTGEVKKLFNEGRTLEGQGNMAAAQRLYTKVTRMEPRFVYGWSNLGNTQTAFGDLPSAEESYTKSIQLCQESLKQSSSESSSSSSETTTTAGGMLLGGGGVRRCNDLYILLLNRGTIRLNNGMKEAALQDLQQSNFLRGRPDAIILQNLARAEELNGLYSRADQDYTVAISMTSNEVNPFWLRAAMVKFQLGDAQSAMDLLKRVAVRFPEAPEVRAAYGVLLAAQGDNVAGQRKFLEIPDRQRAKYVDATYLDQTIAWSPAMKSGLAKITNAVGDNARFKNGI